MKPLTIPMKAASLLSPREEHTDSNILAKLKTLKKWPKICTLKVDGIRAVRTTDLFSCRNKLIPNVSIRQRSMSLPYGFDCELYNPSLQYDEIESIVMSRENKRSIEVGFWPIDLYMEDGYGARLFTMAKHCVNNVPAIGLWTPKLIECNTPDRLMECFLACEQYDGEGICFRTPDSPYKQGRSTLKEEYLIKLCRYERTEVKILEAYEQMLNENSASVSKQGFTERSKSIGALTGKGTLGGFIVENKEGIKFRVGTGVGWTDARRLFIWNNLHLFIGKTGTIKSKKHGEKNLPRSPIFVGFRDTNNI